ncbi:unnamed protein product [Prorocentrum cordatum]|uniref:Uncharacterized protein n=1 Tax=Prorocentrum cordatum TaxID=2364126 RepID=A0ABN9WMC3_9DINO|nr:unnamed protein product [Polarella glacialis]
MWGRLAGGGICVSIFHGSLKTCTCALCPMPSKVTAKDLRGGAARYLCDPFHLHHQRCTYAVSIFTCTPRSTSAATHLWLQCLSVPACLLPLAFVMSTAVPPLVSRAPCHVDSALHMVYAAEEAGEAAAAVEELRRLLRLSEARERLLGEEERQAAQDLEAEEAECEAQARLLKLLEEQRAADGDPDEDDPSAATALLELLQEELTAEQQELSAQEAAALERRGRAREEQREIDEIHAEIAETSEANDWLMSELDALPQPSCLWGRWWRAKHKRSHEHKLLVIARESAFPFGPSPFAAAMAVDMSAIQATLDAQLVKIEKTIDDKLEAKVSGLAATVGVQGQMRKEITDRLEKSETRLNAMEQMAQVNSRLPPFVNSQGGKRRAVDSSAGDGRRTPRGLTCHLMYSGKLYVVVVKEIARGTTGPAAPAYQCLKSVLHCRRVLGFLFALKINGYVMPFLWWRQFALERPTLSCPACGAAISPHLTGVYAHSNSLAMPNSLVAFRLSGTAMIAVRSALTLGLKMMLETLLQ